MLQKEYQYWINQIRQRYLPYPEFIEEMSNWRNRSIVARTLIRIGFYEPALELFESIVDVPLQIQEEDEDSGFSEVEDQVWCLYEYSDLLLNSREDRRKAFQYVKKAKTLIEDYPDKFQLLNVDSCRERVIKLICLNVGI